MAQDDVIVVGGGHNGLCCAAYLAKAGRKVTVLERRPVLGGAAVSEEVYPGFTFSVCSYVVSLLRPWILRDLDLARFGLELIPLDCTFSPHPEEAGLCRWGDPERTRREIARFSKRDAEVYPEFGRALGQLSLLIRELIDRPAFDPTSLHPTQLTRSLGFGKRLRELPDADLERLTKLMTMGSADFLDEWFESDRLKAPMSVSGIIGTMLGVRSPGTAYVLLHHYMGEVDGSSRAWAFAKGGTGSVSLAFADAARHHGATVRTEAGVSKILVEGGEATGVVLESGEVMRAGTVISGLEPRLTMFGLVGRDHLPNELCEDLERYKLRGSSGKVNLAVDRLPEFPSRPGAGPHLAGDILLAPSVEYLERAHDDAKAGRFSKQPFLDIVIPSLSDPTVAPPGKHVVSCFVQYAPYHLAEGPETWPSQREAFGDAVVDALETVAPGIRESILHRQVLSPWDLEQEIGLTEGNIFHGELTLEQLAFLRPAPGWAHHRTPIRGLFLCGSGTHPGGGIMGTPGALAARTILGGKLR